MTLTLYRSGSIQAPGTPRATALLTDSVAGEIVWVGTDEAAARLGKPDDVVDLDGSLMVPAFVDAWALDDDPATVREAVAHGIGALHVLAPDVVASRHPAEARLAPAALPVRRYQPVDADALDTAALTERYELATAAGEQLAVVVLTSDGMARVVEAAGIAAGRVGPFRFVAARHRLHLGGRSEPAPVSAVARLGLVVCFGAGAATASVDRPLRALAAEGVAFAFGSQGVSVEPWSWVRRASEGHDAISARAAFTAATRGGHRAARADSAGLLRPGAPATFGVWDFSGELVVRTPDERVAAWSTDPRAATPGLPDLERGFPRCCRTVVDGTVVFDAD